MMRTVMLKERPLKGDIDKMATLLRDVNIGEEFEYHNKKYVRVELPDNFLKSNELAALEKKTYKIVIFQRCRRRFI